MSDEAVQPSAEAAEAPSNTRGKGIFSLIKAAAFLSVIVIVEVVAAAMLAPARKRRKKWRSSS